MQQHLGRNIIKYVPINLKLFGYADKPTIHQDNEIEFGKSGLRNVVNNIPKDIKSWLYHKLAMER